MAEQATIADLLVGLGVKVDAGALENFDRYNRLLESGKKAITSFSAAASKSAAGFSALIASTSGLTAINAQIEQLAAGLASVKSAGTSTIKIKTTITDTSEAKAAREAAKEAEKLAKVQEKARAQAAKDAEKSAKETERSAKLQEKAEAQAVKEAEKLAKAQEKVATATAKANAKLADIGASASAVDKVNRAYEKEVATIADLYKITGNQLAMQKAMTAADAKRAESLKALKNAEDKAAQEAALSLADFAGPAGMAAAAIAAVAAVALTAAAAVAKLGEALAANALDVATDALYVERQATALGLSVERYQELRYTLGRFGVDSRDVADLFGQLDQQIIAAANGSKTIAPLFEKMGLSAESLKNMDAGEQLRALADGINNVTNPVERLAIMSSLLGEDLAKKMTPMLVQGSDAIDALSQQAESLGIVLSQDDVDASRALTSQWAVLTGMVDGLRIRLGTALIPVLTDLAKRISGWYDANKDVIDQDLVRFTDAATAGFMALADAGDALGRIFGGLEGFQEFAGNVATVTAAIAGLAAAIIALTSLPIEGMVIAFQTLSLAVQDFYIYITGGQSVIGTLIDQFGQTDTLLGALIRAFQALGNVASAAFNLLSTAFTVAWDAAAPFRDLMASLADILGGVLLANIEVNIAALTQLLNLVADAANALAGLMGSAPALTVASGAGTLAGSNATSTGTLGTGAISGGMALASALAPTAAPTRGASSTVTVSVGPTTVNGAGLDEAGMRRVMDAHAAEQARQLQNALLGSAA